MMIIQCKILRCGWNSNIWFNFFTVHYNLGGLMNYPSFSIKIKNPWLLEFIKSKDQSFRLIEIDKSYIYFSDVENPEGNVWFEF